MGRWARRKGVMEVDEEMGGRRGGERKKGEER